MQKISWKFLFILLSWWVTGLRYECYFQKNLLENLKKILWKWSSKMKLRTPKNIFEKYSTNLNPSYFLLENFETSIPFLTALIIAASWRWHYFVMNVHFSKCNAISNALNSSSLVQYSDVEYPWCHSVLLKKAFLNSN